VKGQTLREAPFLPTKKKRGEGRGKACHKGGGGGEELKEKERLGAVEGAHRRVKRAHSCNKGKEKGERNNWQSNVMKVGGGWKQWGGKLIQDIPTKLHRYCHSKQKKKPGISDKKTRGKKKRKGGRKLTPRTLKRKGSRPNKKKVISLPKCARRAKGTRTKNHPRTRPRSQQREEEGQQILTSPNSPKKKQRGRMIRLAVASRK